MSKNNVITTLKGPTDRWGTTPEYNFITLYANQVKARKLLAAANRGNGCHDLYDAYKYPSSAKRAVWQDCQKMATDLGAQNLHITGYNSSEFSVAMDVTVGGHPAVIYRTHYYDRLIYKEDLE